MQRRNNLTHFVLAGVIVFGLTLLIVCVEAQAQIVFYSDRDGNAEIYVMDADGKNQRRLTNNPAGDHSPSWSPDGQRIVFTSNRDGHFMHGIPTDEIYVMDANGRNQQNLTNNPSYETSPSWSPDGKRIAFDSNRDGRFNWEIYVMDADGGNVQRLTNNPDPNEHPDDRYPSWSPDGKRIVFSARREGHVVHNLDTTYEIYVMDVDGGNPQNLTNNRIFDWFPSWSPEGERITFVSRRDGNSEIYVMDADGGNQQNLSNNRDSDGRPAWLNPPFSVAPAGKKFTMWGRLKQVDQ